MGGLAEEDVCEFIPFPANMSQGRVDENRRPGGLQGQNPRQHSLGGSMQVICLDSDSSDEEEWRGPRQNPEVVEVTGAALRRLLVNDGGGEMLSSCSAIPGRGLSSMLSSEAKPPCLRPRGNRTGEVKREASASAAGGGSGFAEVAGGSAAAGGSSEVFCLLCKNDVAEELMLSMPACSCRFCSFCLEPALNTQLARLAAGLEDGMMGEAKGKKSAQEAHEGASKPGMPADEANSGASKSRRGADGREGRCAGSSARVSPAPRTDFADQLECPGCAKAMAPEMVKALAPQGFQALEDVRKSAELIASEGLLSCPHCGLRTLREAAILHLGAAPCGVPEIDRTAPRMSATTDDEGRPLSLEALQHHASHRFRCPECITVFCGSCRRVPYHLGRTCQEQEAWESRPSCRFCGKGVDPAPGGEAVTGDGASSAARTTGGVESKGPSLGRKPKAPGIRELRKRVKTSGLDMWWCVEKKDLLGVLEIAEHVCGDEECQNKLKECCTRTHASCGHPCGGVRSEAPCLPCLHPDCYEKAHAAPKGLGGGPSNPSHAGSSKGPIPMPATNPTPALPCADDFCPICWVDSLGSAPTLLLKCGHAVHLSCAREKVKKRYPGPEISFSFLRCPVCPSLMQHPSLDACMYAPLALHAKVEKLLDQRMDAEGVRKHKVASPAAKRGASAKKQAGAAAEAGAGAGSGAGAGAEAAAAQEKDARAQLERRCLFFECVRCNQPYFGGDRRCGAGGQAEGEGQAGIGPQAGLGAAAPPAAAPGFGAAGAAGFGAAAPGFGAAAPGFGAAAPGFGAAAPAFGAAAPGFGAAAGGPQVFVFFNGVEVGPQGYGQALAEGGAQGAAGVAANKRKDELICGDCVAAEMRREQERKGKAAFAAAGAPAVCNKGHGSGYIQFKCRYCCNAASYFCFGTTHFCFSCHDTRPDFARNSAKPTGCTGGDDCPLGLAQHPPAGQEYCLGCALCRIEEPTK